MDTKLSLETSEQSVEHFRKGGAAADDPLGTVYTKWSTRFKCFEAYVCYTMNFQTILNFSLILGEFGTVALVPYCAFRIFIGIPCVLMKLLSHRFILGDISYAWSMTPLAKALLYCSFLKNLFACVSNAVSLSYVFKYLMASLQNSLPWELCDSSWARENCYDGKTNTTAILKCMKTFSADFCENLNWQTAAMQYWLFVSQDKDNLKALSYSFLSLAVGIFVILLVVYKGIKNLEKCFVLFVFVPVILASLLASITFLIPGAICGSSKIWYTDYLKLFDFKLWANVLDETMLSLGLGLQAVTVVSAHGKFFDDIFVDVLVVTFSDLFCCLLMAAPILSIVGARQPCESKRPPGPYFSNKLEVFVSMSEAMTFYPVPKNLWAILFYAEMFLIGLSTQIIMVLACCETLDGFTKHRISFFIITILLGIALFIICSTLLTIGMDFDLFLSGYATMTLFLMVFTLSVFYGYQRLMDDFHFVMGYYPPLFLRVSWFASGIVSLVILCLRLYYKLPATPFEDSIYYNIGIPLCIYLVSAVVEIALASKRGKISSAFSVNPNWGPQNPILKKSRIIFNTRTVTKEFMYRQELNKKPAMKLDDFSQQNIVQTI